MVKAEPEEERVKKKRTRAGDMEREKKKKVMEWTSEKYVNEEGMEGGMDYTGRQWSD